MNGLEKALSYGQDAARCAEKIDLLNFRNRLQKLNEHTMDILGALHHAADGAFGIQPEAPGSMNKISGPAEDSLNRMLADLEETISEISRQAHRF